MNFLKNLPWGLIFRALSRLAVGGGAGVGGADVSEAVSPEVGAVVGAVVGGAMTAIEIYRKRKTPAEPFDAAAAREKRGRL